MLVLTKNKNTGSPELCLQTSEGSKILPTLWLRERAQCHSQLDAQTQQRLFNAHDLDPDLQLIDAESRADGYWLSFSDGFSGVYESDRLELLATEQELLPKKVLWTGDLKPAWFDWHSLTSDKMMFQAVSTFLEFGFLLIRDTPLSDSGFFELANKFGFIKDTDHGRSYQLVTRPDYNDLGYQPVALSPHTDMPYSNPMPGVQILQCKANETTGGLSTLVDSIACCEQLRAEDAIAFDLLAKINVRFRYESGTESIALDRPLLDIDETGELQGVRYSPRVDNMPLLDEHTTKAYQRARRRLGELFNSSEYELKFGLRAGEAVMFDNSRVLHGRTAYDPNEGLRHLEGCYLDRDGPAIRYLTLQRNRKNASR